MSIQEEAKCIIGKDYPQRIVIHEEASSKNTKHMNSIKEKLLKELNNEVCTMLRIFYIALLHIMISFSILKRLMFVQMIFNQFQGMHSVVISEIFPHRKNFSSN